MIEIILISSIFISLLLIIVLLVAFDIKRWSLKRDTYYARKHAELQDEINELKKLFINEMNTTLTQIKNILK